MKWVKYKSIILLTLVAGAFIWIFKGSEARQKWVFRIKNIYSTRRQIAEKKSIARNGGVLLDDIEMAAFHK